MGKWIPLLPLGIAALACGTAEQTSPEPAADARSVFRAGLHHPGVFDGPAPLELDRVRWTFQTDGTVRSTPAVTDDRVYVGSGDQHLYALDRDTGAELWRFDAGSPVQSVPAVEGDAVFVTTLGGTAFAVAAGTGRERWRVDTGPLVPFPWGGEGWDYFAGSPTVVADRVVFGAGDGIVRAVDAATGGELWRFETKGRVRGTPAVHEGHVLIGSFDGHLYVLDLEDGSEIWRFATAGAAMTSAEWGFDRVSIQSSAAVVDGVVYIGARDANLYAIDRASGAEVWRINDETAWVISSPAVADGVVYSATSSSGIAYAVGAASGEELWRTSLGGPVFGSPAVVGETVVVTDLARYLSVLDRATGRFRWRYRTGGAIKSSPVAVDGTIYFGSDDGVVYALDTGPEPTPRRAVFWDEDLTDFTTMSRAEAIMESLRGRGYEVLDAPALAEFMRGQIERGGRSVIVFAQDWVPEQVAPGRPVGSGPEPPDGDAPGAEAASASDAADRAAGAADSVFRGYLEAGGKIVWLGYPPLAVGRDPATGDFTDYDLGRSEALLDMPLDLNGDDYGVRATAIGQLWGLPTWWTAFGGIEIGSATETLGLDENDRASAWVKEFGGPRGTGFVYLQGSLAEADLGAVARVAEYGILRQPAP